MPVKTTRLVLKLRGLLYRGKLTFHDGDDGAWVKLASEVKVIIRPQFQREFIYPIERQKAVAETILAKCPLGTIYFGLCDDGEYEMIDGQQRTLSILHFINGDFSVELDGETTYYHNFTEEQKEEFLNYAELSIYLCEGTEKEKLTWFRRINMIGMELNDMELTNAVYHGPFISSAREYFSKRDCRAIRVASIDGRPLVNGTPIRQDILKTALTWWADSMEA